MDQIIKIITSNNALMILGLFLVAILLFAIIKQVLKLIYLMVILVLLYGGYLFYTGQKIPKTQNELMKHGIEQLDKINKSRKKFQEDIKNDKIPDDLN